jgi:hypothetical protein
VIGFNSFSLQFKNRKLGDKNAPEYDEENYKVAKFAMFQVIFNTMTACNFVHCNNKTCLN